MKRRSFLALLGLAPAAASISHAAAEPRPSSGPSPADSAEFGAVSRVEILDLDYDGPFRVHVVTGAEARGVGEIQILAEDGRILERAWWIA